MSQGRCFPYPLIIARCALPLILGGLGSTLTSCAETAKSLDDGKESAAVGKQEQVPACGEEFIPPDSMQLGYNECEDRDGPYTPMAVCSCSPARTA